MVNDEVGSGPEPHGRRTSLREVRRHGRGARGGRAGRPRPGGKRGDVRLAACLLVLVACLLGAPRDLSATVQQPAQDSTAAVKCESCHAVREFLVGKAPTPELEDALLVTDSIIAGSSHRGLSCAVCHTREAAGYPHRGPESELPCRGCHTSEARDWDASIHAANDAQGDAATCVDCHDAHRVYAIDDRRSPVHPFNVATTCGRCHADERIVAEYFLGPEETQARVAVEQYYETVHGTAMSRAGLAVSATCNDCHRGHKVLPADSPESSVNRAHVAETCEQCHLGITERYERSSHGRASPYVTSSGEVREPPVCTDCHTSHQIVRADEPRWFIGVVEECGECHERVYKTYFDTYHGQVTALGFGLTAKCSDCHSPHLMLPASDEESTVHPINLVKTCGQCHPDSNWNFTRYYAHGDHRDRRRYPVLFWTWAFMTTLLVSVWSFFGTYSLLWLGRSLFERAKARRSGAPGGHRP
jgi:hypothetical protein